MLCYKRHLLYAGHRSGHIKVWDLRRQKPVVAMQEHKVKGVPSSVIDIHLLLDDNYFICSAFNSKVSSEVFAYKCSWCQCDQ